MAVLLKSKGKIKKYPTTYPVGNGEGPPDKYVADCGREFKIKPKESEECSHLECAIHLAKLNSKTGTAIFILGILFALITFLILWQRDFEPALIFSGISTLAAFLFLIKGYKARKQLGELVEYRDNGTINGFRAWKV